LLIRAKKLAHQQGAKLAFKGIPPAVKNVIQIARLEKFLENDDPPDTESSPKRSTTWRDAFGSAVRAANGPSFDHPILPEPVTNAALATSLLNK
jgi:hypothetical protein